MTNSTPGDSEFDASPLTDGDAPKRDAAELIQPPSDSGSKSSEPFLARPIQLPPIRPRSTAIQDRSLFDQLWLPIFLLAATCFSTFFAGAMRWQHAWILEATLTGQLNAADWMRIRCDLLRHYDQGLIYMVCVVGILFAHEMGHYVATRIYKVPASFPFFIPFFPAPIGTMGAVIAMQNHKANRKEIFDIGIAGPLAGLVLAIPITCLGIAQLDVSVRPTSSPFDMPFDMPLLVRWIYAWLHPNGAPLPAELHASQVNAMFMAGWVGLLITGLNMLPVSQLDGGHVTYTLFGKYSRTIAQVFIGIAVIYMVWQKIRVWTVMLLLIFFIGIYHPPTSDDSVPLGRARVILGCLSLLIPVLCFPPRGLAFF